MVEVQSLNWFHVFGFVAVVMGLVIFSKRVNSKKLSWIACIIMILVSGLRHGYVDTRTYRSGFENLDISNVLSFEFLFQSDSKDKGFYFISAVFKWLTNDSQMIFLLFSILTVGLLFWGIHNMSEDADFAIFLFIATGCYLDTMNGMRQALASAIIFFFLPKLLKQRKIIPYIIIVLLVSTIHASAIIFIPIYFIATKKAWSVYTGVLIVISLIIYVFFNTGIGNLLVELLDNTSYGSDYGEMILVGNTSVNIIRIIVAAVPLTLAYFYKENIPSDDENYNICFNMSVLNFMTWLFASKVLYFYRLAMYFTPFTIVFLCYVVNNIKNEADRKIIKTVAVVLYFAYFIYQLYTMGDYFFVGYLKY